MLFDEVRYIVDVSFVYDPFAIGVTVVLWDLGQSNLFDLYAVLVQYFEQVPSTEINYHLYP